MLEQVEERNVSALALTLDNLVCHRNASEAWLVALARAWESGQEVQPRDQATREVMHATTVIPMSRPVVAVPARKLAYSFMAAEALAIVRGDNRVGALAPYAPHVAAFSDDGVTFAGAYGPRVVEQLPWVVEKLLEDRDTRQAVLEIWRPAPKPSKDIPCTIALVFSIRHGWLNCHAFMRSSDVWLGLPYDLFSFSMVAARVACELNVRLTFTDDKRPPVQLGWLLLTAVSSHLYKRQWEEARRILAAGQVGRVEPRLPDVLIRRGDWHLIEYALESCRDKTEERDGDNLIWRIRP